MITPRPGDIVELKMSSNDVTIKGILEVQFGGMYGRTYQLVGFDYDFDTVNGWELISTEKKPPKEGSVVTIKYSMGVTFNGVVYQNGNVIGYTKTPEGDVETADIAWEDYQNFEWKVVE